MREDLARGTLLALQRLMKQMALYPLEHPSVDEAMHHTMEATAAMCEDEPDALFSIRDDSIYLNREILPHCSLEFNGFMEQLLDRGVESITFLQPVTENDMNDLVMLLLGRSDDLPAGGTIRLNEDQGWNADDELSTEARMRRAYAGSLNTMRSVTKVMARDGAFDLGAVMNAVEALVDNCLSQSAAALLLANVKSHDEYTFYHSVNACLLSLSLGKSLGLTKEELVPVGAGALLHDIGKVAISPAVLNHPGRLTRDQWKEVRIHPQEGAHAIMAAGGPGHEIAATVALEHHARFDGKGYPNVTRAGRPHPFSRLVAVADMYDAVTTRRSYRRAETPSRALQLLLAKAGDHHDPDMVQAFITLMGVYPPGSILKLANGLVVVVTHHDPDELAKPHALVALDAAGKSVAPESVDVDPLKVEAQLLPGQTGIDPVALLESVGIAESLLPDEGATDVESRMERSGVDAKDLRRQATDLLSALAQTGSDAA